MPWQLEKMFPYQIKKGKKSFKEKLYHKVFPDKIYNDVHSRTSNAKAVKAATNMSIGQYTATNM